MLNHYCLLQSVLMGHGLGSGESRAVIIFGYCCSNPNSNRQCPAELVKSHSLPRPHPQSVRLARIVRVFIWHA